MTIGITQPQQFIIDEVLLLTGQGAGISFKPVLEEMSIFETLFDCTINGYVIINDAEGFIEKFNINGFNFINIQFSKFNPDDPTQFNRTFRIYNIDESVGITSTNYRYMIKFCSEELFVSTQKKIAKSYTNMTIRDMVENVLQEEMLSTKLMNIELTEGNFNLIVPYKSPYETINWLATYAKPSKNSGGYVGADMFFYESKKGFNFRSLQSMYKDPIYNEYFYSPQNTIDSSNPADLPFGLKSMITCQITKHFNTIQATMDGVFANKFIGIDTMLRTKIVTGFKYDDYMNGKLRAQGGKKPITLNAYPLTADYKNRFGKTASEMTDARVRVSVVNTAQRDADMIKDEVKSLQSTSPNIDAETRIPYRLAQFGLANYIKVEFTIPGDPNLTVGSIVKLHIPSLSPNKNTLDDNSDKYYSGKYLVDAVRHVMTSDKSYKTICSAITDSLSSPNVTFSQNAAIDNAKG
jgi:hypothetical protein